MHLPPATKRLVRNFVSTLAEPVKRAGRSHDWSTSAPRLADGKPASTSPWENYCQLRPSVPDATRSVLNSPVAEHPLDLNPCHAECLSVAFIRAPRDTSRRSMDSQSSALMAKYLESVHSSSRAHYKAADIAALKHNAYGIGAALCGVVAGTSLIPALGDGASQVQGVFGLLAAILASISTFGRYGERAETHRESARAYATLRRAIELAALDFQSKEAKAHHDQLDRLSDEMDQVAGSSPLIPHTAYVLARREISKEKQRRVEDTRE